MASEADHRRMIKYFDHRVALFAGEVRMGRWIAAIGFFVAVAGWNGLVMTPDEILGLGVVMVIFGAGFAYLMNRDHRAAEAGRMDAYRDAKRDGVDPF